MAFLKQLSLTFLCIKPLSFTDIPLLPTNNTHNMKTVAAVCSFPSVRAAVDTAVDLLQAGVPVAKMEFLDQRAVEATNRRDKLDLPVLPTLFLEFNGSVQSVEEQAETASEALHIFRTPIILVAKTFAQPINFSPWKTLKNTKNFCLKGYK